ncbi:tripartite tricarboxylate transporter substrate binding protein [uncultured Aeromicrobium sp.]|uniref:Bug family tripartite tricarboxylate transporter substrate binding protein n=1 Tax=uncultured Aeromicrobium sp. TaxID=337820 RepID=UPI0025E9EC80|nr:tripartite tricarboxylate transporter substrate binding protein [uncultured Aeromicrobium sp.]
MTTMFRWIGTAPAVAGLVLLTAACGGNLGSDNADEAVENFPDGPVTLTIGQDPGGSTDLIGRALAGPVSEKLGVSVPVVNRPGANGALAAKELQSAEPDGQNLMVINMSLAAITPLAVSEDQAVDVNDFEIVTGVSTDDYVLVTNADNGWSTVDDLKNAGKTLNYATTGVGTGSQLSSELLFKLADIPGRAVPFDGGAPALTAVLGNQADVASVQLGEAMPQIEAGEVTPIVTFAAERNQYLDDVPTAVESGYEVEVQQARAIAAPKGTPQEILDDLKDAFDAAFETQAYQDFNTENLLTPNEVSGDEVVTQWTEALDRYRQLTEEYDIDLGGGQ